MNTSIRVASSKRQSGFTLLELSIVIIVIGLIIGGVMTGKNLLAQSKINSVIRDTASYNSATTAFLEKYQALPGDFSMATNYWGTASGGCPNGTGTGTQTCNGNGDGIIFNAKNGVGADVGEIFRFWQHLANAGLISGVYSGVTGPGSPYDTIIDFNSPRTKMNGCTLGVSYLGQFGAPYTTGEVASGSPLVFYDGSYGHFFYIGQNLHGLLPADPCFSTADAYAIDQKLDDGKPGLGNIVSLKQGNPYGSANCATTTDPTTAVYNTGLGGSQCILIYRNLFK